MGKLAGQRRYVVGKPSSLPSLEKGAGLASPLKAGNTTHTLIRTYFRHETACSTCAHSLPIIRSRGDATSKEAAAIRTYRGLCTKAILILSSSARISLSSLTSPRSSLLPQAFGSENTVTQEILVHISLYSEVVIIKVRV